MTTRYFTPIATGADNRSLNWNSVYRELDEAVTVAGGTRFASPNYLFAHWMNALFIQASGIVYDSVYTDVIKEYSFLWADGSDGRYLALTIEPEFLETTEFAVLHGLSRQILYFSGLIRDNNGSLLTPGTFEVYSAIPQGCIDNLIIEVGEKVFSIGEVCVTGTLQVDGELIVI
jgi:hypothetical protein